MQRAIIAFILAASLAGCATQSAVVPALNGKERVPINRQIPAVVPLAQPNNSEIQED